MKKLTSLEDTATITITGRDAVMLHTLVGRSSGTGKLSLFGKISSILPNAAEMFAEVIDDVDYISVQASQEALAFPKELMLKELQSKMDALQCEIDKIKGESF